MSAYSNDIEMIMDFLKLSLISNDNTQTKNKRDAAYQLQKMILDGLPEAKSDRITQIYQKMNQVYKVNGTTTDIGARIERLRSQNRQPVVVQAQPHAMQMQEVQSPLEREAKNLINSTQPHQGQVYHGQFSPGKIGPKGVRMYQPVPSGATRIFTTETRPTPGPQIMAAASSPIISQSIPTGQKIMRVSSPVPGQPDRFVVFVTNSKLGDAKRVQPVWKALSQSHNIPSVLLRKFDLGDPSQRQYTKDLQQRLRIDPSYVPAVYRVDLSSGSPRVVRFSDSVTLENLKKFVGF